MLIKPVEAPQPSDFQNSDLRSHAEKCKAPKDITKLYRILRDDQEVAFLAIDRIPGQVSLVLYDLFVAPEFRSPRGQGVGNGCLSAIERMAADGGFKSIVLNVHPKPPEGGLSAKELADWYGRRGYRSSGPMGQMTKHLDSRS